MPNTTANFPVALPAYSIVTVESTDNVYLVTSYYTTAQDVSDVISDGNYVDLSGAGGTGYWETSGVGLILPVATINNVQIGSDPANIDGLLSFVASDGDVVDLAINTDDQFSITGGDVGIGTATPAYPLDVVGIGAVDTLVLGSDTITSIDSTYFDYSPTTLSPSLSTPE